MSGSDTYKAVFYAKSRCILDAGFSRVACATRHDYGQLYAVETAATRPVASASSDPSIHPSIHMQPTVQRNKPDTRCGGPATK